MPFRALLTTAASAFALAIVLATATPASAHDVLAGSVPAADITVRGDLDQVTLTFSEPPLAGLESGIVISVTDPDGTEVGSGDVDVDGSTLRTAADLTTAGAYTVTWRSVSVDGHPISGSYRFTSSGVPAASPTTGTSASPSAAAAAPSASATASSGPASALADPSGPGATPWVLGGIAALVAAALVTALVAVRRRTVADD